MTGRPKRFDRNLVVIGAGSAGLVAALTAAKLGAKVTLVEAGRMGGDCLNTGCVPSKALIHAARLVARARRAAATGLIAPVGPVDGEAAFRHARAAIAAVAPHDSVERYQALGVDVRLGHAHITSPWTVAVDGAALTTPAIVVATGAAPTVPAIAGLDRTEYLTSETLWRLERVPRRLAILGGGPVGCELAQAFGRLGSDVTLVEQGERLLHREDDAVSVGVRALLERDGVRVLTDAKVLSTEPGVLAVTGQSVAFDTLLVAVGRTPRTAGFGLEELGIGLTGSGTVAANAFLQTSVPNIYVCGDVAGPFQFTHAAGHQGAYAAINALFGHIHRLRPSQTMPAVTFTDPEIARVGLNEREARQRGVAYEVTRHEMRELDRAIVDDDRDGFVSVLTVPGRDRILGATIVAPRAGEMLAEFGLAMRADVGLKTLFATIHAYPTYTEANRDTAGAWRAAHAPARLLRWLGRYHAWRRGA
jgi:pyruvate/2-oxoglutarate dehydrogenase complex dihydrolipoamide dehydrogenase (E3) component